MKTALHTAQNDRAFLSHFDRPIAFHRSFVTITGSITAALMLSQLVYWTIRSPEGEWIFKTREQWLDEIGLSRKEQEHARKLLRDCRVVEEVLRGVPAKVHFRINLAVLKKLLSDGPKEAVQLVQKGPTGRPKRSQLDGTKGANKMAPLAPSTKGANSVAQKGPTNIRKTTHRLQITPPNPPIAQAQRGGHLRRLTRRQRSAMVGVDNGWRTPTAYPGDPRAQKIYDYMAAGREKELSLADAQYIQDVWQKMKREEKETVH